MGSDLINVGASARVIFSLRMYGARWLGDRATLSRALTVLESDASTTPISWGIHELERRPYNTLDVLNETQWARASYAYFWLGVEQDPAIFFELDELPCVHFRAEVAPESLQNLYRVSTDLGAVFAPDFGVAGSWSVEEERSRSNDDAVTGMIVASSLPHGDYLECGPIGLGVRTWIGSHFVSQFSSSLLDATPDVFLTHTGDATLVDLVERPWSVGDLASIANHWQNAMAHLESAKVFAERRKVGRHFEYFRNVNCEPGNFAEYDESPSD
jgi:hypothetical protein